MFAESTIPLAHERLVTVCKFDSPSTFIKRQIRVKLQTVSTLLSMSLNCKRETATKQYPPHEISKSPQTDETYTRHRPEVNVSLHLEGHVLDLMKPIRHSVNEQHDSWRTASCDWSQNSFHDEVLLQHMLRRLGHRRSGTNNRTCLSTAENVAEVPAMFRHT